MHTDTNSTTSTTSTNSTTKTNDKTMVNQTLDLVCFSDKLRDLEKTIIDSNTDKTDILPLSLIAKKQNIVLPKELENTPFYLISKHGDSFFTSGFRVYSDNGILGVCDCFNLPLEGFSIDLIMIGSNYQLPSYAKCSYGNLSILIPVWHKSIIDTDLQFGGKKYLELLPAELPDDFIKPINRINYVSCHKLPLKKSFRILDEMSIAITSVTRKSDHDYLLICELNGCKWIIKPNRELFTAYNLRKIKSFSLLSVDDKKGNGKFEFN